MHELFEHTADVGLRVRAASLERLFEEAAEAMLSLSVANLDAVAPVQSVTFQLSADSYDDLLRDWLSELNFTLGTRRLVCSRFAVQLDGTSLRATAWGEPIDPVRHQLALEIKAVTYHGLKVERDADGWLAEVIVDI
jgi:SHS2 domain-containing protein